MKETNETLDSWVCIFVEWTYHPQPEGQAKKKSINVNEDVKSIWMALPWWLMMQNESPPIFNQITMLIETNKRRETGKHNLI